MKKLISFILLLTLSCLAFGHNTTAQTSQTIYHSGIGLGSVIAVVISWDRNKSIFFAIIHGIFGWLYVIYFALTRTKA
ncbi:hypothetical protein PQ465_14140 [Sphingobacterium oryzagri]|uniref:CPBP family intramembrane metalloprotease n=1 Tax=Sphingobacterium oryzagri TaxID=3025669 RepID=A0ABY7WD70_9SPHI|nr:hypothetical protein [Sphingobacterium sp. KACC 22765]WDF67442.1 hypothetical protein PQ465_14140 [Sphingobacterium sp. KACC 22765]